MASTAQDFADVRPDAAQLARHQHSPTLTSDSPQGKTIDSVFQGWLDSAVDRLRHVLHPELILLFGSWARGTATRRSDVDLFILWDCELSALDRIGQVLTLLADAPYPIEAIVYTPDELSRCGDRPFIRQLLAEGLPLYERGKATAGSEPLVSPSPR